MTEKRPPACHYDRHRDERVTRDHRDDCTNPETHGGCAPCTAPHCVLCGQRHLDNDHPLTCPDCIGTVRQDLEDIRWECRFLRWQASRGGRDGQLAAAAPIPGANAMIMITPGHEHDDLRWAADLEDYHRGSVIVPPLVRLASWNTEWRTYLGHTLPARPTVAGITHYLADHLTAIAQADDGPDWIGFARAMRGLRRELELVLHDEREGEQGVSCFECGDHLVRRYGRPKPCRHKTPARVHLAAVRARAETAQAVLAAIATYPELRGRDYPGGYTHTERRAARGPTSAEQSAALVPCSKCTDQGGIEDPSVGQSWECLGCRKQYTPGEYAHAVRRDLLEGGPDGDGWTHVGMAAEAASTMTGYVFPPGTVRRWMDRGKVGAMCRWSPGVSTGLRLVFWPDIADEAAAAVVRYQAAEAERRRKAEQRAAWLEAVAAGEDPEEAGVRLGIHPNRLRVLLEELDGQEAS